MVCVDLDRMEMAAVWLLRLDDRHRMVNSADALGEKSFAFLERHHGEGTVYGVDVTGATNVLGHPLLETLEFEVSLLLLLLFLDSDLALRCSQSIVDGMLEELSGIDDTAARSESRKRRRRRRRRRRLTEL